MADLLSFPQSIPHTPASAPNDSPQVAEWRAGLAQLKPDTDPCPGYRHGEWPKVFETMRDFLDRFGEEAARLGWTTEALFAVHPVMGVVRLDYCGGLVSGGRQADAITATTIKHGALTFYRDTPRKVFGVPIWAYQWPEKVKPRLL